MKTYQELRREVTAAAKPLTHPWKTYYNVEANTRLAGKDHPYGSLVYIEGGNVAGKFGTLKAPRYLVARGKSHDDSIWALAVELGLVDFGPDVAVEEVDAGWFWLLCNPEGRLPAGQ
jgi:hypothetical protein